MSVIYKPSGMAREYSPYALNLYIGCSFRCKYCYGPLTLPSHANKYFGRPAPRKNVLSLLEQDLKRTYHEQILISLVGDVYCDTTDDCQTTREALELLNAHHAPVAVLSKGGKKMLRDLDLFQAFGNRIAVGLSLTFLDERKSRKWEPNACSPSERLETLRILHDHGIKTLASFEPTIEAAESLRLIERTLKDNCVDRYIIGKINHYIDVKNWQDWRQYLINCLALLRPTGKEVYYKETLRRFAPDVQLTPEEKNPDEYIVRV